MSHLTDEFLTNKVEHFKLQYKEISETAMQIKTRPFLYVINEHNVSLNRLFICDREAVSNLSNTKSVIAHHHHHNLRTSDDNDLEPVMNTDSSFETCPFASFCPPTTFYNLFKLFF